MKRGKQHDLTSWYIHQLRQLLQEIQFLFWIVFSSMFQHLAKFINNYQQELSFLLTFSVIVFQAIKNACSIALYIQSLAQ